MTPYAWLWVNMIASAVAGFANLWLIRMPRFGLPFESSYLKLHMTIGFGAFAYSVSYGVLIFGGGKVDRGEWSVFMTPFSAVVWFSVWTVPAILYWLAHRTKE